MFLVSAFLIGLFGSFHCIGMCGPIALALRVQSKSTVNIITGRLLYNAGRILTYSVLGLIIGFIGHTLAISGLQKSLSIISGTIILLIVALSFSQNKFSKVNFIVLHLTSKVKQAFKNLFGKKSKLTLFLIGTVNGLLPCGFVYLALVAAASTGNFLSGMSYMSMFGLGTLPMMFSLSLVRKIFNPNLQPLIRKASLVLATALAVFLIYRGIMIQPGNCCHR
jgi:sulfite exporter TauE/SafE